MHYVYIYTNKINNKKYIGQTTKTLEERAGSNFINYKESWKFYNALMTEGIDNFEREIVYSTDNSDKANLKEIELIKLYKTQEDKFGYNIQPGGALLEMNDDIKIKIGNAVKKSKKFKENNFKSHAKSVVAIEIKSKNVVRFASLTDASNELNISRGNIGSMCNGKGRCISLNGYIFKFEKDFNIDNIDNYISDYYNRNNNRYSSDRNKKVSKSLLKKYSNDDSKFDIFRKKVICVDTGEIFNSVKEAAISKNIKATSNITLVCNGKRNTAGGFHWKFLSSTTIPDECKGVGPKS